MKQSVLLICKFSFMEQVEEKIGDVSYYQIFYIQLSNRLNFKYIGLEHASLPHRTQVPVSDKKQMHLTCYAVHGNVTFSYRSIF